MFRMTSEATNALKNKAYVLADRLFPVKSAIDEILRHNETSEYKLHLVTKCKKNSVACTQPEKKKSRGKPRKKGRAIRLNDLFRCAKWLKKKEMALYRKPTMVSYACFNLPWGSETPCMLLFVLVSHGNVASILATTDLAMNPEDIIRLYSLRQCPG